MKTLRLKKTEDKYIKHRKNNKNIDCPICPRNPLNEFKHWKIIKNNFPYDRIAKKHTMLTTKRHTTEKDLNQKELSELKLIKDEFMRNSDYNYIMEATNHTKSLPGHFHLHLIVLR